MKRKKSFWVGMYLALISISFSCQKELVQDSEFDTLGKAANQLLTDKPFSSLFVEINFMPGLEPDTETINSLAAFLQQYLNKPEGITVRKNAVTGSGKSSLTLSELVRMERDHRTTFTYGKVIAVHILITDTEFSQEDTFATSYWNTSFCLFGKTIVENSGRPGQIGRQQLISILLQHEFGHLLGLVDQGSPMQQSHRDVNNGAHCDNDSCLMYYAIETTGYTGPSIQTLDAACRADLKANGGK